MSNEKLQKRWFPVYFQQFQIEKMIWQRHVLGIPNTHLWWAKSEKKLMMKSRENAQKPVFPAYFRHFRPEKKFLQNRAPSLWISVQNFMKKYKVQLEKFKKCHFFRRKFRRFLESYIDNLTMLDGGHWLQIMFVWKKQRNIRKKSNKNLQKRRFPVFSAEKKCFSKIGLGHILGIKNTHLCAKNQKKLMINSREKAQKPVFPAYFRHFRPEKYAFQKSGSITF